MKFKLEGNVAQCNSQMSLKPEYLIYNAPLTECMCHLRQVTSFSWASFSLINWRQFLRIAMGWHEVIPKCVWHIGGARKIWFLSGSPQRHSWFNEHVWHVEMIHKMHRLKWGRSSELSWPQEHNYSPCSPWIRLSQGKIQTMMGLGQCHLIFQVFQENHSRGG